VERLDAGRPSDAAFEAVSPTLQLLSRSRSLLVGAVALGEGPGMDVAPWTLQGVRRAAHQAELRIGFSRFDPPGHRTSVRRRLAMSELEDADEGHRCVTLEVRGEGRPRRVPQAWFGRHLCLVVPCVHIQRQRQRQRQRIGARSIGSGLHWTGPIDAAFAAIARACSVAGEGTRAELGARIAGIVFTSTTVVIDATWWAPLRNDEDAPPDLLALDRCLATGSLQPTEAWNAALLERFDPWLAGRLRLTPAAVVLDPELRESGSGAHVPWPRAPAMAARARRGLAGQALQALWKGARPETTQIRLPPAAPGPMARCWHNLEASPLVAADDGGRP
jgi:hypothetical protein